MSFLKWRSSSETNMSADTDHQVCRLVLPFAALSSLHFPFGHLMLLESGYETHSDGTQTEYLFPLSQSQGNNLVGKVEKP